MTKPTSDGVVPWPDTEAARYRAAGYWQGRSIYDHFADSLERAPDKIAVVDGDTRLTYRDLADRAAGCAVRLLDLGIEVDDRVLLQLPNTWEFVAFTLACFRIGVVPVMALPAHRSHELEYLAALSESVAIVVPDTLRDFDHELLGESVAAAVSSIKHVLVLGTEPHPGNVGLGELLKPAPEGAAARLAKAAPDGSAVACFLLSGGTTGLPKLITRTHDDYAYNARATSSPTGITSESVYLVALPAGHNFPLACPGLLGALFAGGTVVMASSPDPAKIFELVERERVTVTAAVPAVAQRWIEYQEEVGGDALASLEVLQVGGSRLADELAVRVGPALGATLQQVFGMAEGLINMTRLDDPIDIISQTQGRPVSEADEVRVVDDAGETLPLGSTGVLLTRGPYTPRGYFRAPEHNMRAFTPDGWYITGDIVELRVDGNLIVQGRDKDMINRGGEKVSGEEVENLVYGVAHVTLAAAVAMPDPTLGERVCVYVTLRPGTDLTLEDVRGAMTAAGVARFKHPDRLVIVEEIPLTTVGKVDKKALRADIAERMTRDSVPSQNA